MLVKIWRHVFSLVEFASIVPCLFQSGLSEDFCIQAPRVGPRKYVAGAVSTLLVKDTNCFVYKLRINHRTVRGDAYNHLGRTRPRCPVVAIQNIVFGTAKSSDFKSMTFL